MIQNRFKNEIMTANYWEHHKFAKELALIYPLDHPKRISVENEMNIILKKLNREKI